MTATYTKSQIRITITSLPKDTPEDAEIFLASSLNQWNPNEEKFRLKKQENGLYSITLPLDYITEKPQTLEYKFTLGSWNHAEGDQNGNSIENRKLNYSQDFQNIENQILSWVKSEEKNNTASKNVKILAHHFSIPQLKTSRRIWVYLPPNYATSKKKYPVMYMEDGQNLFNDAIASYGEWRVDETLDSLSKQGIEAIIVGIDNGGTERLNEYSPWKNQKYGGGKGDLYAQFIANTLKPYIDKKFRTLSQPKNTGLIGSSMGGLISFYIGLKYPEKFGKLGIFSPSFWFDENSLKFFVNKNNKDLKNTKIYFLAGKKESQDMTSDIEEQIKILENKGLPKQNICVQFDENGTHSESYWSQEFPKALIWLMK